MRIVGADYVDGFPINVPAWMATTYVGFRLKRREAEMLSRTLGGDVSLSSGVRFAPESESTTIVRYLEQLGWGKDRIMQAASQLGYEPNPLQVALRDVQRAFSPKGAAWHIPEGGSYGTGYCYLACIKEMYQARACAVLGSYPTFVDLGLQPVEWFVSGLDSVYAVTDDQERPLMTLKSVSVGQVFKCFASRVVHVHGSLFASLRGGASGPLAVSAWDMLGGARVWHVSSSDPDSRSKYAHGICYIHAFAFKYRRSVMNELGVLPTMREVLSLSEKLFKPHKILKKKLVMASDSADLTAITLYDAFVEASYRSEPFPEGSLGARYRNRFPRPTFTQLVPPEPSDLLGGRTDKSADEVVQVRCKREPYITPLTVADSRAVLQESMTDWGVGDEHLDDLLTGMAEVLVCGSCNTVFENASIEVAGKRVHLSVFLRRLSRICDATNSLRLWVRSYNCGEMCLRISGLLDEEQNVALRQVAAAKYGVGMRYVRLCFDTVSMFAKLVPLTYMERVFVRVSIQLQSDFIDTYSMQKWLDY